METINDLNHTIFLNLPSQIVAFLYQILSILSPFVLKLGSYFSPKLKLQYEGQKQIRLKLGEIRAFKSQNPETKFVWFHCASLGEFEQGRPLIEAYRKAHLTDKIVLTFFSPSGYEIRKNYNQADFILYLPLDNLRSARNFVNAIQPKYCIFVKYEFWPYIIQAIKEKDIKLFGISVILRQNQIYFKNYGQFFKKTLEAFDCLYVQNQESIEVLNKNGLTNYKLAGDTRFDRVFENFQTIKPIVGIKEFIGLKKCMVIGSAWPEDMSVLIPFINNNTDIKFIIAPHELHSQQMLAWQKEIKNTSVLYSKFNDRFDAQVLIVDSIGHLSALYQYANYAFIGGAFGKGLHNTLEAAVFSVPIFFGNKAYHKFSEANELINLGIGFPVENYEDLVFKFEKLQLAEIKLISEQFIRKNIGATNLIMKSLV